MSVWFLSVAVQGAERTFQSLSVVLSVVLKVHRPMLVRDKTGGDPGL